MVEPRLVSDLNRVRHGSAKDYCRVERLGNSRREDRYMSPLAVRQPNCCRVVERDV
ncbi:MAG: hypothetical protein H6Q73_3505 [Firmicutes bacterium]|nr:hypothetical protein [Bacillota bacterium]